MASDGLRRCLPAGCGADLFIDRDCQSRIVRDGYSCDLGTRELVSARSTEGTRVYRLGELVHAASIELYEAWPSRTSCRSGEYSDVSYRLVGKEVPPARFVRVQTVVE